MVKITKCAFGKMYDISVRNYFSFLSKDINEISIKKLESCLIAIDSKIYHIIQEELSKEGFYLDDYGDITQNKT